MKIVDMAGAIALGLWMELVLFIHSTQISESMGKSSHQKFFSIMFFLLLHMNILPYEHLVCICLKQIVFYFVLLLLSYCAALRSITEETLSLVGEKSLFSALCI